MMSKLRTVALSVLGALVLAPVATAQKQLLYWLDFETHVVGQLPTTGASPAPCRVVSDVLFGDPTIVASHGPLTDRCLQFGNGTTGYDQIQLRVENYVYANRPPFLSYEQFQCEMDLVISNLTSPFTVHFSGSGFYWITFFPDRSILAWTSYGAVPLGNYTIGARHRWRLDFDLRPWVKTLTCTVDGVARPPMNVPGIGSTQPRLRRIRWNLTGNDPGESVAIDNLKVYGAGGNPAVDLGQASARGADLALHSGSTNSLDLHGATANWPLAIVVADAMQPTPLFGGVLVPDPGSGFTISVLADGDGSHWLTIPFTAQPWTRYLQAVHIDLPSFEAVLSNAIQASL